MEQNFEVMIINFQWGSGNIKETLRRKLYNYYS
jgi:hypothetical protein